MKKIAINISKHFIVVLALLCMSLPIQAATQKDSSKTPPKTRTTSKGKKKKKKTAGSDKSTHETQPVWQEYPKTFAICFVGALGGGAVWSTRDHTTTPTGGEYGGPVDEDKIPLEFDVNPNKNNLNPDEVKEKVFKIEFDEKKSTPPPASSGGGNIGTPFDGTEQQTPQNIPATYQNAGQTSTPNIQELLKKSNKQIPFHEENAMPLNFDMNPTAGKPDEESAAESEISQLSNEVNESLLPKWDDDIVKNDMGQNRKDTPNPFQQTEQIIKNNIEMTNGIKNEALDSNNVIKVSDASQANPVEDKFQNDMNQRMHKLSNDELQDSNEDPIKPESVDSKVPHLLKDNKILNSLEGTLGFIDNEIFSNEIPDTKEDETEFDLINNDANDLVAGTLSPKYNKTFGIYITPQLSGTRDSQEDIDTEEDDDLLEDNPKNSSHEELEESYVDLKNLMTTGTQNAHNAASGAPAANEVTDLQKSLDVQSMPDFKENDVEPSTVEPPINKKDNNVISQDEANHSDGSTESDTHRVDWSLELLQELNPHKPKSNLPNTALSSLYKNNLNHFKATHAFLNLNKDANDSPDPDTQSDLSHENVTTLNNIPIELKDTMSDPNKVASQQQPIAEGAVDHPQNPPLHSINPNLAVGPTAPLPKVHNMSNTLVLSPLMENILSFRSNDNLNPRRNSFRLSPKLFFNHNFSNAASGQSINKVENPVSDNHSSNKNDHNLFNTRQKKDIERT